MTIPPHSPIPNPLAQHTQRTRLVVRALIWTVAAVLATHLLMRLPGEYSLLVALILAALLPAFG